MGAQAAKRRPAAGAVFAVDSSTATAGHRGGLMPGGDVASDRSS
jgi:hypothetical protein